MQVGPVVARGDAGARRRCRGGVADRRRGGAPGPGAGSGGSARLIAEGVMLQARLVDARRGDGSPEVRLTIAADPRVRAVVASGVALCEDDGHLVLRPLGEIELAGDRLQHLPVRRAFGASELGELVTVVLPDLARRTALDNRS